MPERRIKIFKLFDEQEMDLLEYFFDLTPSERLQALASLQKKNYRQGFLQKPQKKITLRKHFIYGHENEEFLLFLKCAQQNKLRYMCIGGTP